MARKTSKNDEAENKVITEEENKEIAKEEILEKDMPVEENTKVEENIPVEENIQVEKKRERKPRPTLSESFAKVQDCIPALIVTFFSSIIIMGMLCMGVFFMNAKGT